MADLSRRENELDLAIERMLSGAAMPADAELAALLEVAGELRLLPAEGFKDRLGEKLFMKPEIKSVVPMLAAPEGAALVEFMKRSFDAVETARQAHGAGDGFVASVRVGDSDVLVMGGEATRGNERRMALHVYVKDTDATYRRAIDEGAVTYGPEGTGEPADRPYGERSGFVTDAAGNHWYIATRPGAEYRPQGFADVAAYLHPRKAAVLIDFLTRAFGAEQLALYEQEGRVMHAVVRMGRAMVEMGEAGEGDAVRRSAMYLYTDDVDAVYANAMAAGGVSISAPADQAYGERIAVIEDPYGNQWIAAQRI